MVLNNRLTDICHKLTRFLFFLNYKNQKVPKFFNKEFISKSGHFVIYLLYFYFILDTYIPGRSMFMFKLVNSSRYVIGKYYNGSVHTS